MNRPMTPDKIEDLHEIFYKCIRIMQDYSCSVDDMFKMGANLITESRRQFLDAQQESTVEECKEEAIEKIERLSLGLKEEIKEWKKHKEKENE